MSQTVHYIYVVIPVFDVRASRNASQSYHLLHTQCKLFYCSCENDNDTAYTQEIKQNTNKKLKKGVHLETLQKQPKIKTPKYRVENTCKNTHKRNNTKKPKKRTENTKNKTKTQRPWKKHCNTIQPNKTLKIKKSAKK